MPRPRERSTLLKSVPRAPGCDRARQGDRSRPDRGLVRGRGPDRAEEQDHPALGTTGNAALGAARSAHRFHLHLRGYLPRRWQGSRARPARLKHRSGETCTSPKSPPKWLPATVAASLQAAGAAMDRDKEVLVVVLSSHGSPDGLAIVAGRREDT